MSHRFYKFRKLCLSAAKSNPKYVEELSEYAKDINLAKNHYKTNRTSIIIENMVSEKSKNVSSFLHL